MYVYIIYVYLHVYIGNIMNGASCVAAIFFATIAVWIYGVSALPKCL